MANDKELPNPLPKEMHTPRLILRAADMNNDADCAKVNHIRLNVAASAEPSGAYIKPGPEAAQQLRYKNKVHGARQELCTLAPAPAEIFWLSWLPSVQRKGPGEENLEDLVGFVALSFRPELPWPDMGYVTVAAHAGRGYASEAGAQMLQYWRDFVGVREMFVGCPADNPKSQRCAQRIGFARAGELVLETGSPSEPRPEIGVAFVLPGMEWPEGVVVKVVQGWKGKAD